ncbi:peptidase S41 [Sphingomonas sp. MAH-20]|uniref:Peptidase S41 n=1 Tax=Sphingomonas horti TaxID=2682842 RepID=A0A6I4IZF5_9SPHN|nr:S41 family peptidase [Sphingomonas horti]MBA2920611.1 peptidase S41 [Sphingomonas sp. CGMCC 1.13658]MVO77547.1 peptidase S41 [Sphingomonas horti]
MLALAAILSGCGGGGGGSASGPIAGGPSPAPSPSGACSLSARQNWAFGVLNEWYLFPETLPASLDPTPYATVGDYIDALTATARGQGRDRFFTYLTSIKEEDAFYNAGASAGFGFRLSTDAAQQRAFVAESFEGAPAFAAGMDRGDEIVAIGETGNLRLVSDIIAASGTGGVSDALGPATAGVTRTLRLSGPAGTREITITKADYSLQPVSSRYGAKIIDEGGRRIGYLNLRTFITTADSQLKTAFGQFQAAGVTDVIVDLRYNGGGLVDSAQLLGDLLGRARFPTEVQNRTVFRPEKASRNETRFFRAQGQSVAAMRIAFIGTGATASASELAINSQLPYFQQNMALVGANTYGKPVGQIAIDRSQCDDRLRVIAFATKNANGGGDYYTGLAGTIPVTCQAGDDLSHPLGDPQEASVRQALDFIAGKVCTPIPTGQTSQRLAARRELLRPARPSAAQREVPGLF